MTTSRVDPGTRRLRHLTLAVIGLILAIATVTLPGVAGAQDEPSGPAAVVVHQVDATQGQVEVMALADNYQVSIGDVAVSDSGKDRSVGNVRSASSAGRPIEIVVVVDTSNELARGEIFEQAKEALAGAVNALPSAVSVSVVSAGDTALVELEPTTDHAAAATAIRNLTLSDNAKVFNAIDRAATLFSNNPMAVSTVVVFSGSADSASSIGSAEARRSLATRGAQIVAVRYAGGETMLADVVAGAGGISLSAGSGEELRPRIANAFAAAGDRLLVSYEGVTQPTIRGDATLRIGGASTSYSYPGGVATNRIAMLRAVSTADLSGPAILRSKMGLYISAALAFVGLGLAVYAGMSLVSGETSLQGLIDRYSGAVDGGELTVEEQAIVQTALVRRAVEFSESFAEDRGFLTKIEDLLEQANLPLRPGEAMSFFAAAVFFVAAGSFVLTRSIIAMLVFTLIAGVVLIGFVRFKARRRVRSFEKQLPDTLSLLAGTLRAGYSLPQGLEAVSHEISDPMGYELRRVMTEARLGRELEDALAGTAERLSSPDFAWAVMAIGIQREVGGNLNELLMTVADTMVARERLKGEVAALTAEGKMSAMILGGLPPALGFVMWIMNPAYINVLFTETLGKVFMGLGIVSAAIGMAWMKKVITINV